MQMADLYLVLRSRLEAVAEWINLGVAEMSAAQKSLGLSDERIAREVSVSTRTWIRWRQRGQVPVYMLDRVAEVLQLEIERPTRKPIILPGEGASNDDVLAALRALDRKIDVEIAKRLDRIEDSLRTRDRESERL